MKARVCGALLLVLAACAVASSASAGSGAQYKVVYIPGLTGNPFYSTVACGAKSVASKLGVDFSVQGAPTFAVTAQTPVVEAVVAAKPSAIMISNDDPKAMIAPLKAAQSAGIKVVNIDGDLADKSVGFTNIQSNNIDGGTLAGQEMGKLLKGKGSVVIIDNDPGFPIAQQRVQGFQNAIAKFPGIKVLGVQYSHNETANAASIVTSTAAAHSDLAGVYTVETNNTEGAITGVREAHLTGKVKIVGYDTSDPIVSAIKNGTVSADVVQYPYGEGQLGLQSIVKEMQGKSVPREQTQPFVIATPANINTAKVQRFIYKISC
jgi:ribose transport system substrate-binding protein